MVKIPVKFNRVAAVFAEGAKIRTHDESSGSEHSESVDLSDLVNLFIEREITGKRESEEDVKEKDDNEIELQRNSPNSELKDSLKKLLGCENDGVKRRIHAEVEKAYKELGDYSSSELKRRLMARLRDRGFNAGLCKSKWEKKGGCIPGDYEYIDVNVGATRYAIEVFLAEEFKIARPTDFYASLLQLFLPIFVGKMDELNQIVRLMCSAIKKSMKRVKIHVPPWRRLAYMQAKWFGSYKRTINEIPVRNGYSSSEYLSQKRTVGFVPVLVRLPEISFYCREDFARQGGTGARLGNLASALKDSGVLLER
ncbi:unnamed protein product [Fraxinus pennsylvanica]|uniref:DUF506 family protein n=1 Tax=Fraxinus pennsylvanica TaxID=56036 RepID=A0AAD2A9E8_9LAMI|nr:unnamed protein product [Fraxinus pennsylvanica]